MNKIKIAMYTTNAIEAVNSGFRKVTKRGSFSNDNSVFKVLYLRITEFYRKWAERSVALLIGLSFVISFYLMSA